MGLKAMYQRYSATDSNNKQRLSKELFVQMMRETGGVHFEEQEMINLFQHMNKKKNTKNTTTATTKSTKTHVTEKKFVLFFSQGLCLSYEHRLIFAQRSLMHEKIHTFLEVLETKEQHRKTRLSQVFDRFDEEGSGMIHTRELQEIMIHFLPPSGGTAVQPIEPTLQQVQYFMNQLDDNQDSWLKRSEFTNFFVDACVRLEAHDDSYLTRIQSVDESIQTVVQTFAQELLRQLNSTTGPLEGLRPRVVRGVHVRDQPNTEGSTSQADLTHALPSVTSVDWGMEEEGEGGGGEEEDLNLFNLEEFAMVEGGEKKKEETTKMKIDEIRFDESTSMASGGGSEGSDVEEEIVLDYSDEEQQDEGGGGASVLENLDLSDVEDDIGFEFHDIEDSQLQLMETDDEYVLEETMVIEESSSSEEEQGDK